MIIRFGFLVMNLHFVQFQYGPEFLRLCGHPENLLFCGLDFLEAFTVVKKIENTMQRFMGCPFECHQGRWPRSVVAGVFNEFRQSGAHAPNFSMTDCDKYIERKLSSLTHCTFLSRGKSGGCYS